MGLCLERDYPLVNGKYFYRPEARHCPDIATIRLARGPGDHARLRCEIKPHLSCKGLFFLNRRQFCPEATGSPCRVSGRHRPLHTGRCPVF